MGGIGGCPGLPTRLLEDPHEATRRRPALGCDVGLGDRLPVVGLPQGHGLQAGARCLGGTCVVTDTCYPRATRRRRSAMHQPHLQGVHCVHRLARRRPSATLPSPAASACSAWRAPTARRPPRSARPTQDVRDLHRRRGLLPGRSLRYSVAGGNCSPAPARSSTAPARRRSAIPRRASAHLQPISSAVSAQSPATPPSPAGLPGCAGGADCSGVTPVCDTTRACRGLHRDPGCARPRPSAPTASA